MPGDRSLYVQIPPDPRIDGWVAYAWIFTSPPRADVVVGTVHPHQIPPEAGFTVTLVGNPRSATEAWTLLSGPHARAVEIASPHGSLVAGVRFRPGTANHLLTAPPAALRDTVQPAHLVAPTLAAALDPAAASLLGTARESPAELAGRLADLLQPLAPGPDDLDHAVLRAVDAVLASDDPPAVSELAATVGLSPRQLRRRFADRLGLSPRELRRIHRLRGVLEDAVVGGAGSWADAAARHGFADQSHLIRELRDAAGKPPESYRRDILHIEHRGLGAHGTTDPVDDDVAIRNATEQPAGTRRRPNRSRRRPR